MLSDEQFNLIWSRCVRNLRQCKYDTKANLSGWVILNFLVGYTYSYTYISMSKRPKLIVPR